MWGGEARPFFSCASFQWMGVESSKVESAVWTFMGAPALDEGEEGPIRHHFPLRKFEFLWADDEGPSHDGITALHTNWASLLTTSESGRENSSPTVALYSQRLHIIFHTQYIPKEPMVATVFTVHQRIKKKLVNLSKTKIFPEFFFQWWCFSSWPKISLLFAFCKLINLAKNMTKMLKNHIAKWWWRWR